MSSTAQTPVVATTTTTSVTTTAKANTPVERDTLASRFLHIFLMFLGGATLLAYMLIFRYNRGLFVVVVCLYLIAYSLFATLYTNKKKNQLGDDIEYKVIAYLSVYTMFFAIFIAILSLYVMRSESAMRPWGPIRL